jgi:hypothetical protein
MHKYVIVSTNPKKPLTVGVFPRVFEFLRDKKRCSEYTHLNQYTIYFLHSLGMEEIQDRLLSFAYPKDGLIILLVLDWRHQLTSLCNARVERFLPPEGSIGE